MLQVKRYNQKTQLKKTVLKPPMQLRIPLQRSNYNIENNNPSLEEISKNGEKMRTISHEKMTNLGKSCVTMTDLMEFFMKQLS